MFQHQLHIADPISFYSGVCSFAAAVVYSPAKSIAAAFFFYPQVFFLLGQQRLNNPVHPVVQREANTIPKM